MASRYKKKGKNMDKKTSKKVWRIKQPTISTCQKHLNELSDLELSDDNYDDIIDKYEKIKEDCKDPALPKKDKNKYCEAMKNKYGKVYDDIEVLSDARKEDCDWANGKYIEECKGREIDSFSSFKRKIGLNCPISHTCSQYADYLIREKDDDKVINGYNRGRILCEEEWKNDSELDRKVKKSKCNRSYNNYKNLNNESTINILLKHNSECDWAKEVSSKICSNTELTPGNEEQLIMLKCQNYCELLEKINSGFEVHKEYDRSDAYNLAVKIDCKWLNDFRTRFIRENKEITDRYFSIDYGLTDNLFLLYLAVKYNNRLCTYADMPFINPYDLLQIIWRVREKIIQLVYPTNLFSNIMNKTCGNKRLLSIPIILDFEYLNEAHANIAVFDLKNKTMERFEPHGEKSPPQFETEMLDSELAKLCKNINFIYIPPTEFCPKIGPQTGEGKFTSLSPNRGFCFAWSMWYIEARVSSPDILPTVLIKNKMGDLRKDLFPFMTSLGETLKIIIELYKSIIQVHSYSLTRENRPMVRLWISANYKSFYNRIKFLMENLPMDKWLLYEDEHSNDYTITNQTGEIIIPKDVGGIPLGTVEFGPLLYR